MRKSVFYYPEDKKDARELLVVPLIILVIVSSIAILVTGFGYGELASPGKAYLAFVYSYGVLVAGWFLLGNIQKWREHRFKGAKTLKEKVSDNG